MITTPPGTDAACPRTDAALARNDRYVREFVEAFNLCPYARRCRESGKLWREVVLVEGGPQGSAGWEAALGAALAAVARVEAQPEEAVEVALLLFPTLAPALAEGVEGAHAFERFAARVREGMQARARGEAAFYLVAFHPAFACDLADEHRAVRFIRKSPDPTLQLVRAELLRKVRGPDPGASRYLDVSGLTAAELMAVTVPLSLSDTIAAGNLATLRREGPDRLEALLAALHGHRR